MNVVSTACAPPEPQMELFAGCSAKLGAVGKTEGIKYSGSKLKLLPYILRIVEQTEARSVFDGFSGTTRVSQALAQKGLSVTACDHAVWSRVFGECYLHGEVNKDLEEKIKYLNSLEGRSGWFTAKYGGDDNDGSSVQDDGKKRLWQTHNTMKLDAIRPEIDRIAENNVEKSVLITSLIRALDTVDNSLGHFASYLKEWSPRSYNTMKLKTPNISRRHSDHRVLSGDIFDITPTVDTDLSYFDPPYGSNNEKMPPSRVRYASYYHIWKTVCLNDYPVTVGAAERRADASDTIAGSVFEEFRRNEAGRFLAVEAIEKLLATCQSKYILLSYSNGGRATKEELLDLLHETGAKITTYAIDYKRNVMAGMRWTNDWTREDEGKNQEFLFLLDRT